MSLEKKDIVQKYVERYGRRPPIVIRAQGRVNLIGEHTDYNDGFVCRWPSTDGPFALKPTTTG